MKKNSTKNLRINSEVQKELAILISSEVKDPRISPLTSVTDVEVATDLKTAKVYVKKCWSSYRPTVIRPTQIVTHGKLQYGDSRLPHSV